MILKKPFFALCLMSTAVLSAGQPPDRVNKSHVLEASRRETAAQAKPSSVRSLFYGNNIRPRARVR